jgi:hypothetical protein
MIGEGVVTTTASQVSASPPAKQIFQRPSGSGSSASGP